MKQKKQTQKSYQKKNNFVLFMISLANQRYIDFIQQKVWKQIYQENKYKITRKVKTNFFFFFPFYFGFKTFFEYNKIIE